MCREMCVGTGLRACDMQPYGACSPPPPPPPLRCCRCLLRNADPDPDLDRAHLLRCVRNLFLLLLLLLLPTPPLLPRPLLLFFMPV